MDEGWYWLAAVLNFGRGAFSTDLKRIQTPHSLFWDLWSDKPLQSVRGCLVQVGNCIELEAVGLQFEPYLWRPCGLTWDSSWTVVVISCGEPGCRVHKPLQSVSQAAESKFEPLQIIWQSFPKAISEENRRFWLQNQELLGQRSGTGWAVRTG